MEGNGRLLCMYMRTCNTLAGLDCWSEHQTQQVKGILCACETCGYVHTYTALMSCVVCVATGSLCNAPMSCLVALTSDVSTKTTLSSLSHLTWQILGKQVWDCGILYTALEDVLECDSTCTCVGLSPHPSPAVRCVCVCVCS